MAQKMSYKIQVLEDGEHFDIWLRHAYLAVSDRHRHVETTTSFISGIERFSQSVLL